jgi:hypothetical protein
MISIVSAKKILRSAGFLFTLFSLVTLISVGHDRRHRGCHHRHDCRRHLGHHPGARVLCEAVLVES